MKPIVLLENRYSQKDLDSLKESQKIWSESDIFQSQLEELFVIQNPEYKFKEHKKEFELFFQERTNGQPNLSGNWVYFPWNGNLVHMVTESEHFVIRTNRNHELITIEEQEKLYHLTVGIAGLSIGNSMALMLAYGGLSKNLKLSDFDILETANLNRVRAGLPQIGKKKIDVTIEQVYEINPYAEIIAFDSGLNKQTLESFLTEPKPDVILEAIDDFEMKIRIRLEAKKAKIPVIMMTSLGDRVLVDVERYDTDTDLEIFNGLVGNDAESILNNPISEADKQKYAVSIVGKDNVPARAMQSLPKIGKSLVGRPQLMSTVSIASGFASYLIRQIALGKKVESGRKIIKFNDIFQTEE